MSTGQPISEIRVAQLGAGFIGQVHSLAYRAALAATNPIPAPVRLALIADERREQAETLARQYGWEAISPTWEDQINDPSITLFDNTAPNHVHVEPCIAAARAGKHVLCEKPLAPSFKAVNSVR
jgi:predicted dehydrogenase